MKKVLIFLFLVIFAVGILSVPLISDQFADANSRKKIQFTQTVTSSQDPSQGREGYQMAFILLPSEGTLYDGSLTYSASEPVQTAILHEINETDSKGQPIWTIDGTKIYALSLIGNESANSIEFTGSALALHSTNSKEFTATVSVDGWIRGQPTEIVMQPTELEKQEPSLLLSKSNVPAVIPMHKGIFNSTSLYYIITDSSDEDLAEKITEKQNWKVELAPPLNKAPQNSTQQLFVFTNGVSGDGIYGYQNEVFSSTPSQESQYSPLSSVIEVTWKKGQNKTIFESAEEILKAEKEGRIEFKETGIVINSPQIMWSDGQMTIREDSEISDDSIYNGGQITEINEEEKTVTFIAHRGWGPDGKTIYYIVTDATPNTPAEIMGIPYSPNSEKLIESSTLADLFQFKNGIIGSGPLGFQPVISAVAPSDENYSPMWKIYNVEWNNQKEAKILETKFDLDSAKEDDLLTVSIARPLNNDYIINCPIIDPFQ